MSVNDTQTAGEWGPPPSFTCDWALDGIRAARVRVTGELDLFTAPQLSDALREALAEARLVVLDLCELDFIDTAGVHVIVDATERASGDGRRLTVLRAPGHVGAIFELTRTDAAVELADVP